MQQLIFVCLLLWSTWVQGQQIRFKFPWGGNNKEQANAVVIMPDSSYLFVGLTGSSGAGATDGYYFNVDTLGKVVYTKTYGGVSSDWFSDAKLANNQVFMAGSTNSKGAGGYDGLLLCVNALGDTVFSKTIGWGDWDFLNSITTLSNGNLLMAGNTYSNGSGNSDALLVACSSSGDTLWTRVLGTSQDEVLNSATQLSDGSIVAVGFQQHIDSTNRDMYMVRISADGNVIWQRTINYAGDNYLQQVIEGIDSGVVVCGTTWDTVFAKKDFYLALVDTSGAIVWHRDAGANYNYTGMSVCKNRNNGYVVTGTVDNQGKENIYVYAGDVNGYYQNITEDGGIETEVPYQIKQTYDDGYILACKTNSYGKGKDDAYVAKIDRNIVFDTKVGVRERIDSKVKVRVYPNPTNGLLYLNTSSLTPWNSLQLTDMQGKIITTSSFTTHQTELHLDNLSSGIYILSLHGAFGVYTTEIIKE